MFKMQYFVITLVSVECSWCICFAFVSS